MGAVLGAKAAAQLVAAPLAAGACCRRGPARVLRASTALLAAAALRTSLITVRPPSLRGSAVPRRKLDPMRTDDDRFL